MKIRISTLLFSVVILLSHNILSQKNILPLHKNWSIQSSEKVNAGGQLISTPEFSSNDWHTAEVPSTVLGTLVKNDIYKNVFVGENLKSIPKEQFHKSWWYRTEFILPQKADRKFAQLEFEGINYRANIWLNGKQIANSNEAVGVYRMFCFDVTGIVKQNEKNVLAVEVFSAVKGEPTVGFVDWNQAPPDNSMGLWRGVNLKYSGDVSIKFPFVKSKVNLETLKSAELTVSAELQNHSTKKVTGIVSGKIGKIKFSKKITLEPNEKNIISFTPQEFKQLKITNPDLWWTYNLGKQPLYKLDMEFKINGKISDLTENKFGIREISEYLNEEGYRGYKLNGKKILIIGGGWVDDLFLNNEYENLKNQIDYIKQMGLNTIRLEGVWGTNHDLFDLCDEQGVLMMVGWSCQWEWENHIGKPADEYGAVSTPEEIDLIAKSFKDQVKWLRNHPGIFVWLYGSDKLPRPELEKKYHSMLKEEDPTRPFLAAASERESSITGKTSVKMRGPYDFVPPIYWWIDKRYGGAFGFNTEIGPGAQVPPIESIKKMMPENHLWPIDSVWDFHCAKNEFGNLTTFNREMAARLSAATSLEDYCTKAQYLNYENIRAMFEANQANKYSATGVIHWMVNAALPKLWWQLYDYYLLPGGAFYGTKKANEPLHILYDYSKNSIAVVNNTGLVENELIAKIRVLNFDLTEKFSKIIPFKSLPDQTVELVKLPELEGLSKTYFVDLRLTSGDNIISSNFYCLSTTKDVLDYEKSSWFITPTKVQNDLTELNKLEKVHLTVKEKFNDNKEKSFVESEITNETGNLAFQIVLSIQKGEKGESVLPIFWDDNYFSLLPGEKRIVKGYFYTKDLEGEKPVVKVSGWNIK